MQEKVELGEKPVDLEDKLEVELEAVAFSVVAYFVHMGSGWDCMVVVVDCTLPVAFGEPDSVVGRSLADYNLVDRLVEHIVFVEEDSVLGNSRHDDDLGLVGVAGNTAFQF